MNRYAFPLAPHEIDQLPNADRVYATLAKIADDEIIAFDDAAGKYERVVEDLKNTLLKIHGLCDAVLRSDLTLNLEEVQYMAETAVVRAETVLDFDLVA